MAGSPCASRYEGDAQLTKRHLGDAARHQPGLAKRSDAHRDIDALCDQIDDLVVEPDVELDGGVAVRKLRQSRQQQIAAECNRHVDPQLALRLGPCIVQALLGVTQLVEDAPAASQEIASLRGQAHLASRAVQQPHAEVLLERRDVPAGGGTGDVELVGRPRERASIRDPDEHTHCEQLVHVGIVQEIRNSVQRLRLFFEAVNGSIVVGRTQEQ